MAQQITRRTFISHSVMAGSGLWYALPAVCANQKRPAYQSGRVVTIRNNAVRTYTNSLNGHTVYSMLNLAMERFFEVTNAVEAWKQLFSPHDVVGIKINCLAGRHLSTSPELVDAIIENLQQAGIKKQNIIVWDRANHDLEKAGYKIRTSAKDVRYYGNDYAGYHNRLFTAGEIGSLLSNIVVNQCTAIINVPILKDHGIVGVTNALKNFFGAIHNPNKYHTNAGNPYIADVHLIPELRAKIRLTISDVLTSQCEGGPPFMPQWAWPYNGLMVAQDMVAMDTIGWNIIEKKRAEHGLPALKQAGREPRYISTAADAHHRLGICDPERIEHIEI